MVTAPDAWSGLTLAVSVILKLGLVVALIYASLYLLRRWQSGAFDPARRQVTIVESARLTPRQALHLVRAGERLLLIGATDQSLTLLAEVEPRPAEAQPTPALPAARLPDFAAALSRALAWPARSGAEAKDEK